MPRCDASPPQIRLSTVGAALRRGVSILAESNGGTRADALVLLAHGLGRSREWIVAHGEEEIAPQDLTRFTDFCERRRRGEPVAYITGSSWFYAREFGVSAAVLVPRPETEHLVDEAVQFVRARGGSCRVLDVGTGSGAIACSVAAETVALVDATDVSAAALAVARLNSERLGVSDRCRFFRGDLAAPVASQRYDVVVANLPYVPTRELADAPDSTSFEPRIALDGGADGLRLYRALMPSLRMLLKEPALILLEAAPATIENLKTIAQTVLPNDGISIGRDYAGLARYLKAYT